jgi:hypothetical protein
MWRRFISHPVVVSSFPTKIQANSSNSLQTSHAFSAWPGSGPRCYMYRACGSKRKHILSACGHTLWICPGKTGKTSALFLCRACVCPVQKKTHGALASDRGPNKTKNLGSNRVLPCPALGRSISSQHVPSSLDFSLSPSSTIKNKKKTSFAKIHDLQIGWCYKSSDLSWVRTYVVLTDNRCMDHNTKCMYGDGVVMNGDMSSCTSTLRGLRACTDDGRNKSRIFFSAARLCGPALHACVVPWWQWNGPRFVQACPVYLERDGCELAHEEDWNVRVLMFLNCNHFE